MEDQVSPKRCGHFDGKDVVSRDEMVQKIKAAVDSRVEQGGGGGGGYWTTYGYTYSAGAAGGSGVVILSVPTANYTGTTTGSPTVTTSGSNTIIKFTSSGTYTA